MELLNSLFPLEIIEEAEREVLLLTLGLIVFFGGMIAEFEHQLACIGRVPHVQPIGATLSCMFQERLGSSRVSSDIRPHLLYNLLKIRLFEKRTALVVDVFGERCHTDAALADSGENLQYLLFVCHETGMKRNR